MQGAAPLELELDVLELDVLVLLLVVLDVVELDVVELDELVSLELLAPVVEDADDEPPAPPSLKSRTVESQAPRMMSAASAAGLHIQERSLRLP